MAKDGAYDKTLDRDARKGRKYEKLGNEQPYGDSGSVEPCTSEGYAEFTKPMRRHEA